VLELLHANLAVASYVSAGERAHWYGLDKRAPFALRAEQDAQVSHLLWPFRPKQALDVEHFHHHRYKLVALCVELEHVIVATRDEAWADGGNLRVIVLHVGASAQSVKNLQRAERVAHVAHFSAVAALLQDFFSHLGQVECRELMMRKVPVVVIGIWVEVLVLARVHRASIVAKPHIEALLK